MSSDSIKSSACKMNSHSRGTVPLKVPSGQNESTWEWYHWIGLEKDINCYRFLILISLLNIWKDLKILCRFMQKWIQPPACSDHGLHRILSSYWLAHLTKKSAKVKLYLVWIAGCCNSLTSRNPKNNWCLSHVLEHGSAKKIAAWAHANRDPNKLD